MATPKISCKSQQVDICIEKGATFDSTLTWKIGDPSLAKDLTGYTARMQIRSNIDDTTILHEMTTEDGGVILGGVLGTIDLYISDTDTSAFTWAEAVYDLELIDAGNTGFVRRFVYGDVETTDEVTR
jgi:hypothetical protein